MPKIIYSFETDEVKIIEEKEGTDEEDINLKKK